MLLEGLSKAPRLEYLNLQGSGVFPMASRRFNPYACLTRFAGIAQHSVDVPLERDVNNEGEGTGCRRLRTLCLGQCHELRLLGCKTLLRCIAANASLTALDVTNVLATDEGEALLHSLPHAAPGLRALAMGGVYLSDNALARLALCHGLTRLHLYACGGFSPAGLCRVAALLPLSGLCVALPSPGHAEAGGGEGVGGGSAGGGGMEVIGGEMAWGWGGNVGEEEIGRVRGREGWVQGLREWVLRSRCVDEVPGAVRSPGLLLSGCVCFVCE